MAEFLGLASRALALFAALTLLSTNSLAQSEDQWGINSEIGRQNNQSLLWGPYRPNLYFGVRPRIPKSVMASLLWAKVEDYNEVQNHVRYTCEQNEGMAGYGWDEFDTRRGGIQSIHDAENGIDLTTSFVKVPGGTHGGSWAVRIKGTPRPDAPADLKVMLAFVITQEGEGSLLDVAPSDKAIGYDEEVVISGKSEALGSYKIVVSDGEGTRPASDHPISATRDPSKTVVRSATIPAEHLWQIKPILFKLLKDSVDQVVEQFEPDRLPPPFQVYQVENKPDTGNIQVVQKIFEGPFEFDVLFSSGSAGKDLTSDDLSREIKQATESFGQRYSSVLAPKAPFTADKYKKFGRSMFSNLIGGIGYFEGQHLVDRSNAAEYDEDEDLFWEAAARARARRAQTLEGPFELFSSIPSRPFFPRGFLWDEGFHLLPIADWDMDLTLEIVKSWFSLMDEDGWIAREMILGAEARTKVPEEFQVQYPHYANPPTLFFVIDEFVSKLQQAQNGTLAVAGDKLSPDGDMLTTAYLRNPEVGLEYLRHLYPLLRRQFDWFRRTQSGDVVAYDRTAYSKKEAYRWRGRTPQHILTSGLDDYPRPQPPSPAELHVDLMSWMGMMTKSLINIATAIDRPEEVEEFAKVLTGIEHNLDDLHWSEAEGCYCDATVDDFEENKLVCHKGYISLFPFLTGLIKADSPKLGMILDLIGDPQELWSNHGLRSLSKKSEFYGTDENYWRSPVWININYLAVKQLYNIATQQGPHQSHATDLYTRLRINLVETVYTSWAETGFAWEQYNPETGKGQRTQHFTGWTSLIVKIMAMDDLSAQAGSNGASRGHVVRDEL